MLEERYPHRSFREDPPVELLGAVRSAIASLDTIGPECVIGDLLGKFERGAFDGLRRKTIIENSEVRWLNQTLLKQAMLEALPCFECSVFDVVQHLLRIEERAHQLVSIVSRPAMLNDEDLLRDGWVYLGKTTRRNFLEPGGTTYKYAIVGEDWARFFLGYRTLKDELSEIVWRGLVEGRVLAVEETTAGPLLVSPKEWGGAQRKIGKKESQSFVMTRDLPENWFYSKGGPRSKEMRLKKKAALEWLELEYQKAFRDRRKATKEDTFLELERRWSIQGVELKKEIWKEADIPFWKKAGAPKKDKKYLFDK